MTDTPVLAEDIPAFEPHPGRGRFNAAFFRAAGPYLERAVRARKSRVFADLPREVVEIGPGVGANLRYLAPGTTLVAIEPNPYMHERLRSAAARRDVHLELFQHPAERTRLDTGSIDAVISSLVLCSVHDPEAALAEIRRVLRPGGTFRFLEHVVAAPGTVTRAAQRALRRPWSWTFEGCSCERDLEAAVRGAGFAEVTVEHYRARTPFLPFNPHIAGIARA
jgi:SAM-dependent methyltransferase